eukprot:CAMPEP_0195304546 /NCGR_PEP_ID=MMETSP0707-20130614/34675_1 /TAXON_ID=33640 /ORGANISM="Asterionellopsis glacialis, Strain CCMP134" /LENGTH=80 /DNA_ID=CAMNT_0040368395 /DNA_START=31 /DNA_END=273 /DNA_ORIENTATION=+
MIRGASKRTRTARLESGNTFVSRSWTGTGMASPRSITVNRMRDQKASNDMTLTASATMVVEFFCLTAFPPNPVALKGKIC